MLTTILYILVVLLAGANLVMALRRYLMMFQQNSYRPSRYRAWLSKSAETTSWRCLLGMLVFLFSASKLASLNGGMLLLGVYSLCSLVSLSRKKYKKPLVMTARARRIFVTACFLAVIIAGVLVAIPYDMTLPYGLFMAAWIFTAIAVVPLYIVVPNWLLKPVENSINRRYYRDAERILASMPDLRIIGVTGSYGKTTTKHYLHAILSEQFETLMTPGSFNTTLGVVRTIREYLKPYHEVFIVEMGAKQTGDIKEICDLVHPSMGIITAVGPQHLESFKTIENVQATKFELADSLPADGLIVVNNDFPMIASRKVSNTRCIRYAVKEADGSAVDYAATDIEYTQAGTSFTVVRRSDGHSLRLFTRLVGECNISNILAAVAIAQSLGVADDRIRYAVERIEQVEHRLSIKRIPGGMTIIDDAFNSNPVGSAMALDVLAAMKPGKRILITPGMIELGSEQFDLNKAFGKKAASCCDVAIVVGRYNRDAIVGGLNEGGMPAEAIRPVDSFTDAQALLHSLAAPGDTVLYENDLPDTFK